MLRRVAVLLLAVWQGAALAQAELPADPPGRVGRIAVVQGVVSWYDLDEGRWDDALVNRPLTTGDRVATGRDAQAELRIGSTTVKLGEATEIEFLRLDDERMRIQLHRGTLALRVRVSAIATETDVGTAEAWLLPRRAGLYRLERQDDTTWASAWRGELAIDGEGSVQVDAGQRVQLWRDAPGAALRHRVGGPLDDAFAARVLREDRDDERSASAAHVSPETTGFEDLDRHGRWDTHPDHGSIWIPAAVADDWVPYRYGRWAWVRPWGWTCIDDQPWGFAPFHYGRWAHWRSRWVWVPGPYIARPVFVPALVAWIDGPAVGIGLRLGGPTLSWLPLAPWEPYRPSYRVSPGYHDRLHPPDRRWRPPPRGGRYEHHRVPGAVTVTDTDRVPRPRPPREGFDEPRPHWIGRDRATPRAPPPPAPTGGPLPTRPQPVQPVQPVRPVQPVQPVRPPPPRLPDPPATKPSPGREDRVRPAVPPPPVAPLTPVPTRPPPPPTRPEGPSAKPQTPPKVPAPTNARPREPDRDKDRDEGRGRGGAQR